MKKFLTIILSVVLVLSLTACGGGSDDNNGNVEDDDIGFIDNLLGTRDGVKITTSIEFYEDLEGTQISSDEFIVGTNIYVFVNIHFDNESKSTEIISMEAEVPNAEYIDAWFREGFTLPKIEVIDTADGPVTTFTDIEFSINEGESDEEFIFLIRATDEGPGAFTIKYDGNIFEDNPQYMGRFRGFTFLSEDTLQHMPMPIITISSGVINWTSSILDDGYVVKIGDDVYDNYATNQFNTNLLPAGEYTLKIITQGDGYNYQDSLEASITFTKLETPQVSFNEDRLTWEEVNGATGYTVYYLDESYEVNDNYLEIDLTDAGSYSYSVVAKGSTNCIVQSDESNPYVVRKLETPVLVDSGGIYITWDEISYATSYLVFIDGEFYSEVTEVKFRKVIGSAKEVYIIATGTGDNIVDSDQSEIVIYNLA